MKFIASDGTEKRVILEQAGPDVIIRVENLGVLALRGEEGVVAASAQALTEAGLTFRME